MYKMTFLVAALACSPAIAEDLNFTLINDTDGVLTHFYTSPADTDVWEEDVFGADVLGSGESIAITIADGRDNCVYDMRMIFDDGTELTDTHDMCEMGSYTITE